jgi:hypothetical protein
LRVTHRARLRVDQDAVTHLALVGHWLAYASCGHCGPGVSPDEIRVVNLRTGRSRTVARTHWSGGQMDWVVGSRGVIVFTDQSREQTDSDPRTIWTLRAMDLRTGRTRLLDSSHGHLADTLPTPTAGDGRAVWNVEGPSPRHPRCKVVNLTTLHVRTLRDPVSPGITVTTDDHLVWLNGYNGHVYARRIGSTRTRRLSGSPKVSQVAAGDGAAVWSTPQYNDPTRMWVAGVTAHGFKPRIIWPHYNEQLAVGDGFVAYYDFNASVISLTGGKPLRLARNPDVPSRLAVSGHRVAFSTTRGSGTTQVTNIHIDTISPTE